MPQRFGWTTIVVRTLLTVLAANGQSWMDAQMIDCASLKNPTEGGCRCEIASCALKRTQQECVAPFDPSGAQSYTLCDWGPTGCRACPSTASRLTSVEMMARLF